jgi:hypothetical protein
MPANQDKAFQALKRVIVANTSGASANIEPGVITVGEVVVNTTSIVVGANVELNNTKLSIGNSTVNTGMYVPTVAQSQQGYFLHANGTWAIPQTLGGSLVSRVYQAYTATGGQTDFVVSGGYTVGQIDVFYNGVHLANTEYTASDSLNVVLGSGANSGAIVEVVGLRGYASDASQRVYEKFTASPGANQTFTVTNGYSPDLLDVFINGVHLANDEYTATNGSTVVLDTAAVTGSIVEVTGYKSISLVANSSGGSNGYVAMYNDMLMQWGTVEANSTTGDVTFSKAFDNNIYSYTATAETAGATYAPAITAANTSEMSGRTSNDIIATVKWIAIGN